LVTAHISAAGLPRLRGPVCFGPGPALEAPLTERSQSHLGTPINCAIGFAELEEAHGYVPSNPATEVAISGGDAEPTRVPRAHHGARRTHARANSPRAGGARAGSALRAPDRAQQR